jgi:hypothetical protein
MSALIRRPGLVSGLLFGAVAAWAVLMYELTNVAHDWMPHIAATAATVALTVTLVEWILRKEAEERLRPRRSAMFADLSQCLYELLRVAAWDYALTHVSSFKEIPPKPLEFLDLWLAEQENEDAEREFPYLLDASKNFVTALQTVRSKNLDILPPAITRAIDDITEDNAAAQVLWIAERPRKRAPFESEEDAERHYRERRANALRGMVEEARLLATVLLKEHPDAPIFRGVPESALGLHQATASSLGKSSSAG